MRGSEMITDEMLRKQYYKALVNRDSDFDGIFFAAIKTTGVFCHATCRARKPKFENCFFSPLVKSSATSSLITRFPEVKLFGLAQTKYLRFYTCEVV